MNERGIRRRDFLKTLLQAGSAAFVNAPTEFSPKDFKNNKRNPNRKIPHEQAGGKEKIFDDYMKDLKVIVEDAFSNTNLEKYYLYDEFIGEEKLREIFLKFERFFEIFWSEVRMQRSYRFAVEGQINDEKSLPLQMQEEGGHLFHLDLAKAIELLDFIFSDENAELNKNYFFYYLRNKVEMNLVYFNEKTAFKGLPLSSQDFLIKKG